MALLAPLDPLVWDRDLLRDLFDFTYRWEVYTPKAKRKWGYYVLPVLWGDRLVGRIEPRFDRDRDALVVIGAHWEPGFEPSAYPAFAVALAEALEAHRQFAGLRSVVLPRSRQFSGLREALPHGSAHAPGEPPWDHSERRAGANARRAEHSSEGDDPDGPDATGPCHLERFADGRRRDRAFRDQRCHPGGPHLVEGPDRGIGRRHQPGGAAGRCSRHLLLHGVRQRPLQGRLRPGQDRCHARPWCSGSWRNGRCSRPRWMSRAKVAGVESAQFHAIAEGAKDGCPISRALKGNVELAVHAKLVR